MSFRDLKNLHMGAIDNANSGKLTEDDYIRVVAVSMNSLKVSYFKWFRIEHTVAGIICCHGIESTDIEIFKNLLEHLSK